MLACHCWFRYATRFARVYSTSAVLFFAVIDLGALQPSRVIHVNGLPLGEHFQRGLAGFAVPVARAAYAAERKLDLRAGGAVADVHQPAEDIAHSGEGAV